MFRLSIFALSAVILASCGPAAHRYVENKTDAERTVWIASQDTATLCGGYGRPYILPKTKLAIEIELFKRSVSSCGGVSVAVPESIRKTQQVSLAPSEHSLTPTDIREDDSANQKRLDIFSQSWKGKVGIATYARNGGRRSTDVYNCNDFGSSRQAQMFFLQAGGPVYDRHNLDRDGDGLACEWEPPRKASPRYTTVRTYRRKCYVGPRGGTYTITASGRKNYGGC